MISPSPTLWKNFFRANSLFNLGMSIGGLLFENTWRDAFEIPRDDSIYRILFLALVFVFGVSYWWVSRNLSESHDLVWMGVLGKLTVFFILAYATLIENSLARAFFALGLIDFVLAVGFLVFLRTYPFPQK